MGRIRLLQGQSNPDMPTINDACGDVLEALDEKHGDLASIALALAAARVSRKFTTDESLAWQLAVAALQAAFAFDEQGVAPQWEPPHPSTNGHP